jgi:hypothetical protein
MAAATSLPPRLPLPQVGHTRLLAAWMTPEHLSLFPNSASTPATQSAFQRGHALARDAVVTLAPADLTPEAVAPITGSDEAVWVEGLVRTAEFQSHYGHLGHEIGYLRIDQLTVYQPFVNPPHEPVPGTPLEVLRWCLPHQFQAQVGLRIDGQRATFTPASPSTGIGIVQHPQGVLITPVGNANWVQVKRLPNDRYVIVNGNHRIAALAAAGHAKVPAIISDASSLDAIVPITPNSHRPWFRPEELRAFRRPPLITDFLEPAVTLEVPHDSSRRVVEVRFDIQEFRIP